MKPKDRVPVVRDPGCVVFIVIVIVDDVANYVYSRAWSLCSFERREKIDTVSILVRP